MEREETKVMLVRAYELAYYIHCRKKVAQTVALSAMLNLETAVGKEADRLEYPADHRNKVKAERALLLQRNVFVESEFVERDQEKRFAEENLTHEDMLIRYVKFLVKKTGVWNAFNVLVGLAGFLYSYNNDEVYRQQAFLLQNDDGVKDDAYFRKRKGWLMGEFKKRFAGVDEGAAVSPPYLELVTVGESSQGGASPIGRQIRFRWLTGRDEFAWVARESLNQFRPWDVECFLPATFDPDEPDAIALMRGGDEAELYRIHVLLHQPCFERMIMAFNFTEPDRSLRVPKFFLGSGESNTSACDRHSPPPLDPPEIDESISFLSLQSKKGRKIAGGFFKFVADGGVVGVLDNSGNGHLFINIPDGRDILKVFHVGDSGEVQIASYLFDPNVSDDEFTVSLKNRRQLVVTVSNSESELVDGDSSVELNIRLRRKESYQSLKDRLAWFNPGNLSPGVAGNRPARRGGLLGLSLPAVMTHAAFLLAVIAVITLIPRSEWPGMNRGYEVARLINADAITNTPAESGEATGEKAGSPDTGHRPAPAPVPRKNIIRTLPYSFGAQAYFRRNEESGLKTQYTGGDGASDKALSTAEVLFNQKDTMSDYLFKERAPRLKGGVIRERDSTNCLFESGRMPWRTQPANCSRKRFYELSI